MKSVDDLKAALKKTSDRPTLLLISRQGNNLFLTVKPVERLIAYLPKSSPSGCSGSM